MTKIEFSLIALSRSIQVTVELETSIEEFVNDLIFLFTEEEDIDYENHKVNIKSIQKNTPELRRKIDIFIENNKDKNVKVFQLRSYFQHLSEGENFIIRTGNVLSSEQLMQFHNYLTSLQDGIEYKIVQKQMDELFGELRKTYTIQAFNGSTKKSIGEQDKLKRVCRFCNNTRGSVTFKNVAHAISESLGNKRIILNEECDACNSEFGSAAGIEQSLITFLKFFGVFFGIKGKNGIPRIKGKNFDLINEGQIEIKYHSYNDKTSEKYKDLTEAQFSLDTFDNVVMQDIYKTLCKYSLSVIDSSVLPQFQETISWINGNTTLDKLPNIAILSSYFFFKTHPSLIIYLRQDDNTDLPYAVGVFHYTFLTFIFIIPLTKSDSKDFTTQKEYEKFWLFFKHYSTKENWEFRNFSDNTKQKFTINLNFNLDSPTGV